MLICVVSLIAPHHGACAADEEPDDEVVRDGQQPGLDQGQAAGEVLGVGDVEPGRVVGDVGEGERRVAVGAQGVVAVVGDPPGPAEHAEVEPEDPRRVAAGDEDGEPGDDGQDREGDPEEHQHDQVWHQQQPFDQPQPAGQPGFQPAFDADGVRRSGGHLSLRVVVGHDVSFDQGVRCQPLGKVGSARWGRSEYVVVMPPVMASVAVTVSEEVGPGRCPTVRQRRRRGRRTGWPLRSFPR